jgi:hypothetical protein
VRQVTKDVPELAPWLRWPVWVTAAVVVLPIRLLWEALLVLGRFLERYVGRPLLWLWHNVVVLPVVLFWRYLVVLPVVLFWRYAVVLPFGLLWEALRVLGRFLEQYVARPLVWLWQNAVVVPVVWLWRNAVVLPVVMFWRYAVVLPITYLVIGPLTWLWPRFVRALRWLGHWLIEVPWAWFARVIARLWRPLERALITLERGIELVLQGLFRWVLLPGWHGAGWILAQVYQWVLRPVGLAVAWGWRRTVLPLWRMAAAGGRWTRELVLRPASAVVTSVLATIRAQGGNAREG